MQPASIGRRDTSESSAANQTVWVLKGMMMPEMFDIDQILSDLRKNDGKLWLRICGQTHWEFDEIPIFVLVSDSKQISESLRYLQEYLKRINVEKNMKFTIAFMSLSKLYVYNHGFFQGDDIFKSDAIDHLYPEPYVDERRMTVFDAEYPNEEWAFLEEPRR
jgi:hypothetical protein